MIDSFKEISRIKKKTRLKIEGNVEERLNNFFASNELSDLAFDNMTDLTTDFERNIDGGIIVSEEKVFYAIRIINEWFLLKETFEVPDIVKRFVPVEIIRKINWKTKRALVAIRKATFFDDTRHLNNPIRLIIKTATGEVKDKA